MASMVENARKFDWDTWAIGIMRSLIQGGASGVTGGVVAMGIDPAKFNLASGIGSELEMIGFTFLLSGIFGMMTFLKTHGAPDPEPPAGA